LILRWGVIAGFVLAAPAWGCSVAMCLDGGWRVHSRPVVEVSYQGRPLPGASVTIQSNDEERVVSGVTDATGRFAVPRLKPGEYWMKIEYLDISAAYHCFHVSAHPLALVWNFNRVPVANAKVTLQHPRTLRILTTHTASDGSFAFDNPGGDAQVLRIEGGTGGREYTAASDLVRLADRPLYQHLNFEWAEVCGPPYLRLTGPPRN